MKKNSMHFGSTHRPFGSKSRDRKKAAGTQNNKAFPCEEASLPAPSTNQKPLHSPLLDLTSSVRQALGGQAWELPYKS